FLAGKIRAAQVSSRTALFAAEKALVRFQHFRELFSVVLDAFRFSESHALSAIEDYQTHSLLDVAVARNSAGSAVGRNRRISLRWRGLRPQRINHSLRDVFAPA